MSSEPKSPRSIFMAAIEKSSLAEREAYLDEACARDPQLRSRVEELLRAHLEGDSFLEKGAGAWQAALGTNDALEKLAADAPQAAELVKLRYFAGYSLEEAAELLGVSRASSYRNWAYARAWLRCELRRRD